MRVWEKEGLRVIKKERREGEAHVSQTQRPLCLVCACVCVCVAGFFTEAAEKNPGIWSMDDR